MFYERSKAIIPQKRYFQFFENIRNNEGPLAPLHETYWNNDQELLTYALSEPVRAAYATCYLATLEQASFTWKPNLLVEFSQNLMQKNKKNPVALRKQILIYHAAEIQDLFNSAVLPSVHFKCLDIFDKLNNCRDMDHISINLDRDVVDGMECFEKDTIDQQMQDIGLKGWSYIPHGDDIVQPWAYIPVSMPK